MENQKPFIFGKTCEVPKNKKKKVYRYTREELTHMAERVDIPITPQTSNDNLCESLRKIVIDNNLHTYQDFEKYASTLELQKYPSLNDFIMFQPGLTAINQLFEGINDISKFSQTITSIGKPSANGFLFNLDYTINSTTLNVILKSNKKSDNDNLYHEYLAGQCINEFSYYFPFFPRTYKIGMYTHTSSWQDLSTMKGTKKLQRPFSNYINFYNASDFTRSTKISCASSKFINVFIQYLNLKYTLDNYFLNFTYNGNTKINPAYSHQLTKHILILYLTYKTLSKLADYFTHYDLHADNVGIYEIPESKCIDLVIKTDSDVLELKINHIPILIDFGRSYFNCSALNAGLKSSTQLMETVCTYDNRNPDGAQRLCTNTCGDGRGYQFSGILQADGSISNTDQDDYWINRAHRNMSHDLRLMNEIKSHFNFNDLDNGVPYIKQFKDLLKNINYGTYNRFGMPETLVNPANPVNNVHDVANALESIVKLPEFKTDLYQTLSSKSPDSYGTLYIDFSSGGFQEYRFVKH